jgi:hypothetical protein
MKYVFMAGMSGVSVLMISVMLLLSVRDEARMDAQQAAAAATKVATVQLARS